MRRGALLKVAQNMGSSPTSVAGGEKAPGNWLDMAELLGPGSVALDGFFKVLIAPCGGTSGLPYDWARACPAAAAKPAAVATRRLRRDSSSISGSKVGRRQASRLNRGWPETGRAALISRFA